MFSRALGESRKSARHRRRGAGSQIAIGLAVSVLTLAAGGCGSKPRQDATEPDKDFPVKVSKAQFPNRQQLAERTDLVLTVRNAGDSTIPDLVVTLYTGDQPADGAFNIRLDEPNLSNPNRPVWILENEYPKEIAPGVTQKNLDNAPGYGVDAGRQNNFQFGSLAPGATKTVDWRVTPVKGGTYTLHYAIAAGLQGNARAVTRDGGPAKGEFVVTVATKPPQTCVNGAGQVTTGCGP